MGKGQQTKVVVEGFHSNKLFVLVTMKKAISRYVFKKGERLQGVAGNDAVRIRGADPTMPNTVVVTSIVLKKKDGKMVEEEFTRAITAHTLVYGYDSAANRSEGPSIRRQTRKVGRPKKAKTSKKRVTKLAAPPQQLRLNLSPPLSVAKPEGTMLAEADLAALGDLFSKMGEKLSEGLSALGDFFSENAAEVSKQLEAFGKNRKKS